jgi:hypothetical protein
MKERKKLETRIDPSLFAKAVEIAMWCMPPGNPEMIGSARFVSENPIIFSVVTMGLDEYGYKGKYFLGVESGDTLLIDVTNQKILNYQENTLHLEEFKKYNDEKRAYILASRYVFTNQQRIPGPGVSYKGDLNPQTNRWEFDIYTGSPDECANVPIGVKVVVELETGSIINPPTYQEIRLKLLLAHDQMSGNMPASKK